MPGTVVFMGAGASKAFGLPLTDEILLQIVEKLRPGSDGSNQLFRGATETSAEDVTSRHHGCPVLPGSHGPLPIPRDGAFRD